MAVVGNPKLPLACLLAQYPVLFLRIRLPVVGTISSILPSPSTQAVTDPAFSRSVVAHYRHPYPSHVNPAKLT
jgi:hypothetical protein